MTEPTKGILLIVDDEPLKRVTLQIELSEAGYSVSEAPDGPAALEHLRAHPVDAVITDLRMPEMDGMQFLERVKSVAPQTVVIMMTAFGSMETAVEAVKRGAWDCIAKPFTVDVLLAKLERLRNSPQWPGVAREAAQPERLGPLVGKSHAARQLIAQVKAIADSDRPVLLTGEAGCGAEVTAEAIYQLSPRSHRPLQRVSCAAFGSAALEADLFGTPAGLAGPGAGHGPGRLAASHEATLFVDEVDRLSLELQSRLISVIDRRQVERPGTVGAAPADVRLICATTADLAQMVEAGRFRRELHYRLAATTIMLPPLRERREDIPLLAAKFMQSMAAAARGRKLPTQLSDAAVEALLDYHWPGNILELEHTLERAVAMASGERIERRDILLPRSVGRSYLTQWAELSGGLTETIAGVERKLIDAALRRANSNQARAAQFLGIPRTTLRDKMAKYGMVGNGNGSGTDVPPS